jgi:hypothetical protein
VRTCARCEKKLYEGKHREVVLPGKRVILCDACGKITFMTPGGERAEGWVQAITMPARKGRKGRNLTFHGARRLMKGDVLRETAFDGLPGAEKGLPDAYKVLEIRPLVVTELENPEGENKKPRRRKRVTGYAVRAFSR